VSKKSPSGEKEHIHWHPAFAQAIKLELEQYRNALEFYDEFQLTAEPLKIDVVVIKKAPDVTIEKNIARIFRHVNILEYKSPEDYISVSDFYKALGYAAFYAALNKEDMRDMTVTMAGSRYPRELFKYIREDKGCAVKEETAGIYQISGYPLAVQVIESKKLSLEENLWLKGLGNDLNAEAASIILEESRNKEKESQMAAYLYVILQANAKTVQEVLEMNNEEELTLDEVLEKFGLTAKWEARGKAEGEIIGRAEGKVIGKAEGKVEGRAEGKAEGRAEGKAEGRAEGKAEGRAEGKAEGEVIGEKSAWGKMVALLRQGYTVEQLEGMAPKGVPAFDPA
jgi:hypothetical protein